MGLATHRGGRTTRHPSATFAFRSFHLRARLLATTHKRLVAFVVAEDSAALDALLESAKKALKSLAGPG